MAERALFGSVLGAAFLSLAACGGGGGSTSAPATSSAKPVAVTIDAQGDSTMWGQVIVNGAPAQSTNSAPAVLQSDLRSYLSSTITVVNNGVPQATVHESLYGVAPRFSQPLSTRLATSSAKIVVENFGINDSAYSTLDQYTADLNTWIDTVQASGKIAVLEEPNPTCTKATANLAQYVAAINQVAQTRNVQVVHQFDYIKSLPNWQAMVPDCLHPNDALYAIKAQRQYNVIEPLVQSML